MRVLVIYAHPVETSFAAALHATVLQALRTRHEVRDLDLYAEDFDPRLSRAERLGYHDTTVNQAPVAAYVEHLRWAEALVFCFPVWCFGVPAILKGFFDRVMIPGIAFELVAGNVHPRLTNIRHVVGVTTYGRPRWLVALSIGDLPRAHVTRFVRWFCGRRARAQYLALYGIDKSTPADREAFVRRVARRLGAL